MQMIQHAPLVNLVISSGEPAGVGPEVSIAGALAFLKEQSAAAVTLLGDPSLFAGNAIPAELLNRFKVDPISVASPVVLGQLDHANAKYVLNILDVATKGCLEGRYDAMVTAPLQKSVINDGLTQGDALFTGHTEYLAKLCNQENVVMMLCTTVPLGFLGLQKSCDLRVALATTHLP
jgi:4-hydroxythreonine-4-phosphate dehydrogenase